MTPPQTMSLKKREASQSTTAVSAQSIHDIRHNIDIVQSSKRAKVVSKAAPAKPPLPPSKRQQSLDAMFRRSNPPLSDSTSFLQASFDQASPLDPVIQSFTTNASEEPDRIFSESESSTPSSNNTSFMSVDTNDNDNDNNDERRATDLYGTQFSGGTQVDEDYIDNLELQRSFFAAERAAFPATDGSLLDDLHANGPFSKAECRLPPDLPYWYTFELYRISQSLGIKVNWLWEKLLKDLDKRRPSFNEFWGAVKALHRELTADTGMSTVLPPKSYIPDWTLHEDAYCDAKTRSSVALTARLDFNAKDAKHLFAFRLNPITHDKSCRFHRHFGADRFLTIDMPYFDNRSLPTALLKALKTQGGLQILHDSIFEWLTTNDLHIAGRRWRAFYAEPIKGRSRKRRKEEKSRQRLHLFAINGLDFNDPARARLNLTQHQPMSLLDLIDWHLSLKDNSHSTDMRLFARIQLGLSKTLPTIVLESHEFIEVPDVLAQNRDGTEVTDGTIMTDGCARISYQLARAVWGCHEKLGEDVPSAFQARIGGAKGLWQVDYTNAYPHVSERGFWVEIRGSQLKIKPHPGDQEDADESQRTFEVVKYSKSCDPGHLNIQLINIMSYCGVPRNALSDVLNADLAEYLETMKSAMHDPLDLRI